jgi:hypothetical protein
MVLWTVLLAFAIRGLLKRFGFVRVSPVGGSADGVLRSVHAGQDPAGLGVTILAPVPAEWKATVERTFARAAVILVDVSELTDSVAWEVSRAVEIGRMRQLLLICERTRADASAHELSNALVKLGRTPSTARELAQSMVLYPDSQAPIGPGRRRQYRDLARLFRLEMATKIAELQDPRPLPD